MEQWTEMEALGRVLGRVTAVRRMITTRSSSADGEGITRQYLRHSSAPYDIGSITVVAKRENQEATAYGSSKNCHSLSIYGINLSYIRTHTVVS
jgi:hypothetical protein